MIEASRFVLRRWRTGDVAALATINSDTEATRWIGVGTVRDVAQTQRSVAAMESEWEEHAFGLVALKRAPRGNSPALQGSPFRRFCCRWKPAGDWRAPLLVRGFATEAARAVLRSALHRP